MPPDSAETLRRIWPEYRAISKAGAQAVPIPDQAGRHASAALARPANITPLPLPPECPEPNPAESVRQILRDNRLSNAIFASCNDVVGHCCIVWNKLIEQSLRITSTGLQQWAHG